MEKILVYFAIKYNGDWDKIYRAINQKEKVDIESLNDLIKQHGEKYITLLSENYPSRLKSIYKPPFVLFYRGDISLINSHKSVAIVGSRKNSDYGRDVTQRLSRELAKNNITIVSGLAKGIDSIAHESCLEVDGKTIAVLGNGLNISYPSENEELKNAIETKGLVISEYPNNVEPDKENFPTRNRIVAGLSDGVIVSEARNKSGTMITVTRALEMGKDIFCVPYKVGEDSGCNSLIKDGAKLIETHEDVLNEL